MTGGRVASPVTACLRMRRCSLAPPATRRVARPSAACPQAHSCRSQARLVPPASPSAWPVGRPARRGVRPVRGSRSPRPAAFSGEPLVDQVIQKGDDLVTRKAWSWSSRSNSSRFASMGSGRRSRPATTIPPRGISSETVSPPPRDAGTGRGPRRGRGRWAADSPRAGPGRDHAGRPASSRPAGGSGGRGSGRSARSGRGRPRMRGVATAKESGRWGIRWAGTGHGLGIAMTSWPRGAR